jgi:CBS domain containing-hemolysin-like protein
MEADLAEWLGHPVTLILLSLAVVLLLLTLESLLRSLAELGNVRFQGILDDHEKLLPLEGGAGFHISRLLDVLRWLQMLTVGALWLILLRLPGPSGLWTLALAAAVPILVVVLARLLTAGAGEETLVVLLRLVRPMVWPMLRLMSYVHHAPSPAPAADDDEEEASEREIQAFLDVAQAAGIFELEEGQIVESLVDFFDTTVREVMTPRTDMVAASETATFSELVEVFATTHKARIPVYKETVDNVLGVVHVKNVVSSLVAGEQPSVAELVMPCLVVPEGKHLGDLLRDFQHGHQQMAIVVDEYGGTAGLVTLEDVLEEIVGEIQDEHDPKQEPEWQQLGEGVFRLQGRSSLEILEELFGIEIDEEDVDTVGGLVFSLYGTVPEPGDVVADTDHGLQFTVEEVQDRRIVSVTARRLQLPQPQPASGTV